MANKKKDKTKMEDVSPPMEMVDKVYDKRAYSILHKDKQYHLVYVSYNSDLETGSAIILESDKDLFEIEYALEQEIEQLMYDINKD